MSQMPEQIVLVRHDQTEWSLRGRHTGRTDISLTAQGENEARLVTGTLADSDYCLGLPASAGRRFPFRTATVSVLGAKRADRVLTLRNHLRNHGHVDPALPLDDLRQNGG